MNKEPDPKLLLAYIILLAIMFFFIYEGDILSFDIQDYNGNDNIYILPVSYYIDSFMCLKEENEYFYLGEILANDEELEVIGNIYDNKDLIK